MEDIQVRRNKNIKCRLNHILLWDNLGRFLLRYFWCEFKSPLTFSKKNNNNSSKNSIEPNYITNDQGNANLARRGSKGAINFLLDFALVVHDKKCETCKT